jgi:hypothetical protein
VVLPKFGKHVPLGVRLVARLNVVSSVTPSDAKPIAAYHKKLTVVTVKIYRTGPRR